jgi:hypothetical protein
VNCVSTVSLDGHRCARFGSYGCRIVEHGRHPDCPPMPDDRVLYNGPVTLGTAYIAGAAVPTLVHYVLVPWPSPSSSPDPEKP